MMKNLSARSLLLAIIPGLFLFTSCSHVNTVPQAQPPAAPAAPAESSPALQPQAQESGSDLRLFVEDMLVSKGHKREKVRKLVTDERWTPSTGIIVSNLFHAAPAPSAKNPKVMDVSPKYIPLGIDFIRDHQAAYDLAWERYKVSPEVITAILIIETNLGKYPMKYNVFRVYASLTTALDVEYLEAVLKEKGEKYALTDEVATSARKKGNWGLGELSALITLSEKLGIDPVGIYGSFAGALGPAQFIPTSFVRYGVDGNNDGKVDPFDMDDCIASIANYLKLAGWKEDAKPEVKRRAIWTYNHHDVYVNTVLMLYEKLMAASEDIEGLIEATGAESVKAGEEAQGASAQEKGTPSPEQAPGGQAKQ
ncbi:MAG TPA: lytic murein transglycosylase [Deltaproteobacteria bacterium]|jgi:membrane-bound lytic murein transglycosylase B|nr:lytic murein transglycosylase [Deltaproteobacteria bacterium]HOI05554.1 lytic murein transglycosylase [Deltaproteobacteria bacterium]